MDNTLANVVQSSTDYDKFEFLVANRAQSRGHIEAIKRSFEENGNLTLVQPILINEKFQIIDGQHRFTACSELGEPIYYTMVPGLGVSEARSMNILHRNWTSDDYAASYANTGDKNYQTYLKLKEDYGVSHSILLAYIANSNNHSERVFKNFREGNLVVEDVEKTKQRLDNLAEIGQYTDLVKSRNFALGMLRMMASENYDQKRMVSKVVLYGESQLKNYTNMSDTLHQLEEIYNFRQTEANRVRLY